MDDRTDADRPGTDDVALLYDGACPVCTAYGCSVEIAPGEGRLRRIDARGDDPLVHRATAAGLDLDEGMILLYRGEMHHGAEALRLLARLAPNAGLAHRLNRLLFGSRGVSRVAYPILRAGRNLLLRLRGKAKIRNLG